MPHDMELVVQDRCLRSMPLFFQRSRKGLPHVHHGELDFTAFLGPQPLIEGIHAFYRTVGTAEPNRAVADEIAHHDSVAMPFPDGHFVDADDRWRGSSCLREFRSHVLFLEFLDGVPVKLELAGYILDRRGSASFPDIRTKPSRIEGIFRQEVEPLGFHAAARFAVNSPNLELEEHARVAT